MHHLGLYLIQAIFWTTVNSLPGREMLYNPGQSLTCVPNRVPENWPGWTSLGRPYLPDFSVNKVCEYDNRMPTEGERGTMGCVCEATGLDGKFQQKCYRGLADPSIYDDPYLQKLCTIYCGCPYERKNSPEERKQIQSPFEEDKVMSDADTAASSSELMEDTATSEYRNIEESLEGLHAHRYCGTALERAGDCDIPRSGYSTKYPAPSTPYSIPKPDFSSQQCGIRCHDYQCTNRAAGCRCIANRVANTLKYIGLCGIISSGKRDEIRELPIACPCNGTYITPACCDVDNGIVHEDYSNNLGSMVDEKDVYDLAVEAFTLLRDSIFPESQEIALSDSTMSSDSILRARSEDDSVPTLECGKDLPVPLPLPYKSLTDLCGQQESQALTLGCHCSLKDGVASMDCTSSLATSALHNTPLLALCETKCSCLSPSSIGLNGSPSSQIDGLSLEGQEDSDKEPGSAPKSEQIGQAQEPNELTDLKKRDAISEIDKSEHGQGLSGNADQITPHSHTEQTVLSVGCLLVGVTLSIVGSALSWQEKGLRGRGDDFA